MLNKAYAPLIDAARCNSPDGPELLRQLGEKLFTANHNRLASIDDGIRAAKLNLVLYASFFPPPMSPRPCVSITDWMSRFCPFARDLLSLRPDNYFFKKGMGQVGKLILCHKGETPCPALRFPEPSSAE